MIYKMDLIAELEKKVRDQNESETKYFLLMEEKD